MKQSDDLDVSDVFRSFFEAKCYAEYDGFVNDVNSFILASQTCYKKSKTLYFPKNSASRKSIVYQSIRLNCKHEGCPAFLIMGSNKGCLHLGKYMMVHNHEIEAHLDQSSFLKHRHAIEGIEEVYEDEENQLSRNFLVNNTYDFQRIFGQHSFASLAEFRQTLRLFESVTGSQFKIRNSILFPAEVPEAQTLVYRVINLKCVHGGSYVSVSSKHRRPSKTRCIGCMARLSLRVRQGRLIVSKATLQHNHTLRPLTPGSSPLNEGEEDLNSHYSSLSEELLHASEKDNNAQDEKLDDRLAVVDRIFASMRARAHVSSPEWFASFVQFLKQSEKLVFSPTFPSKSSDPFFFQYEQKPLKGHEYLPR